MLGIARTQSLVKKSTTLKHSLQHFKHTEIQTSITTQRKGFQRTEKPNIIVQIQT